MGQINGDFAVPLGVRKMTVALVLMTLLAAAASLWAVSSFNKRKTMERKMTEFVQNLNSKVANVVECCSVAVNRDGAKPLNLSRRGAFTANTKARVSRDRLSSGLIHGRGNERDYFDDLFKMNVMENLIWGLYILEEIGFIFDAPNEERFAEFLEESGVEYFEEPPEILDGVEEHESAHDVNEKVDPPEEHPTPSIEETSPASTPEPAYESSGGGGGYDSGGYDSGDSGGGGGGGSND